MYCRGCLEQLTTERCPQCRQSYAFPLEPPFAVKEYIANHVSLVCHRCGGAVKISDCRRHYQQECKKRVSTLPLAALGSLPGEMILISSTLSVVSVPEITTHGRVIQDGACLPAPGLAECLPPLAYGLQWLLQHIVLTNQLNKEQLMSLAASFRSVALLFDDDFGLRSQHTDRVRMDELQNLLREANAEVFEQRDKISELRAALRRHEEAATEMCAELADHEEAMNNIRLELDARKDELAFAHHDLCDLRTELQRVKDTSQAEQLSLSHALHQAEDVSRQLERVQTEGDSLRGRVRQLESDSKRLQGENDVDRAWRASLTRHFERKQQENSSLRAQVRKLVEDSARLTEEKRVIFNKLRTVQDASPPRKRAYNTRGHSAKLIIIDD
jgi:hypothetical protein